MATKKNKPKKSNHGGPRKGAGRPATGKTTQAIGVRVDKLTLLLAKDNHPDFSEKIKAFVEILAHPETKGREVELGHMNQPISHA